MNRNRQPTHHLSLSYNEESRHFDRKTRVGNGLTSISLNALQIAIDPDGNILYMWGMLLSIDFKEIDIEPTESHISPLISKSPFCFNSKKGWIYLGDPAKIASETIPFAKNSYATIKNGKIVGIWLKSKILEKKFLPTSSSILPYFSNTLQTISSKKFS